MEVFPARDAREEARSRLGPGYVARVLEPSPPAVVDGEWFADDPVALGEVVAATRVVSPVTNGDVSWDELARGDEELAAFTAGRWLGAWPRLASLPGSFWDTRYAVHRIAVYVVSAARRAANGKMGLRWTLGGVGTPFFGQDVQIRVEPEGLVVQGRGEARRAPYTNLGDAAGHAKVDLDISAWDGLDVPPLGDPAEPLTMDARSIAVLCDWYGFATGVLEQLRAEAGTSDAVSRVQIWPEHFDAGLDLEPAGGVHANFGASPGDSQIPEPYLYVGPWAKQEGPFWNATTFGGAVMRYSDLLEAADQRAAALGFLRLGRELLTRAGLGAARPTEA